MLRTLKTALLGAMVLAGLASTAAAQATPEGTVIKNAASASYTDSRGNTYTGVLSDTASVTVGFKAAPDVNDPSASPAPNTTNYMAFVLTNGGNGVDSLRLDSLIAVTGVTLTGNYRFNGAVYASLATLNDTLSRVRVDTAGGTVNATSLTVEVEYSVTTAAGSFVAWVSSDRDLTGNTRNASGTATINAPTLTYVVAVYADTVGTALVPIARETGGTYYENFIVRNDGNVSASYTLAPSQSQTGALAYTGLEVRDNSGTLLSPSESGTIAAGDSVTVRLAYTVHNNTATGWTTGTQNTLTLTATGIGAASAATDAAGTVIAAVTPTGTVATFTKTVTNDAGGALGPTVQPGDTIRYVITVTQGATDATSVTITDALPAEVEYLSSAGITGTWSSITQSGGTVTAVLSGTLAAGTSASFYIQVRIR